MTNLQLWLVVGAPIVLNTVTVVMTYVLLSGRIDAFERAVTQRFTDFERHLIDLWRAELHRVEEVLDARLKHLEEAARR